MTWTHFWAMGGYAGFVWPAYGLTLLVLSAISFSSWRTRKRLRQRIRSLDAPKT